jgi:hypothetical protein
VRPRGHTGRRFPRRWLPVAGKPGKHFAKRVHHPGHTSSVGCFVQLSSNARRNSIEVFSRNNSNVCTMRRTTQADAVIGRCNRVSPVTFDHFCAQIPRFTHWRDNFSLFCRGIASTLFPQSGNSVAQKNLGENRGGNYRPACAHLGFNLGRLQPYSPKNRTDRPPPFCGSPPSLDAGFQRGFGINACQRIRDRFANVLPIVIE